MSNPEWKDKAFCEWLVTRGYSDLVGTSHPYLQKLRVEYEEEVQNDEAEENSLQLFAFYMLGTDIVDKSVTRAWEDWHFDVSEHHNS